MASTARIEELRKKYEENQRRYFAPLANEYRKAGQLEEAIALCRAWLPQQPGHMSGHIVFGQTLFESGELSEARTVFETALELDPENLIALRHLGDIARQHGEIDAARSWYKRVLDADPRNDEIATVLDQLDSLSTAAPASDAGEPAATNEAAGWGDVVEVDAEAPSAESLVPETAVDDSRNAEAPQPDSAETAAWGSAVEREASEGATTGGRDEAESLFDASLGTVAADLDSAPLESELSPLAEDAESAPEPAAFGAAETGASDPFGIGGGSSGSGTPDDVVAGAGQDAANDMGLEVMEFVPPPREPARAPRGEASPFDGHLLEDDADTSAATPAAFVTETMAELYLQQGFRDEALGVYRQLLLQNPDDEALRDRVEQLESGSRSSVGMAAISDEVIESAQRRQAAHTPPSMRAFLAKLAVRRAPRRDPAPDAEGEDHGGGQGAIQEPDDPAPDAGFDRVADDPGAWQLAPDDAGASADESSPYAPDPSEADTAEWIADDAAGTTPDEPVSTVYDGAETFGDEGAAPAGADVQLPDDTGLSVESGAVVRENGTAPAPQRTPGSVASLFSGAVVQATDEVAASALAGAFTPQPEKAKDSLAGRPTRAANSEISLDHVFRESGSRPATPRERSNFSFDQFFSDSASGTSSGASDSAATPDDDAPGDDIEQFNSWLEGLKKK